MVETVSIAPREGLFLASVLARKGADEATIARLCDGVAELLPTGPGTWLAMADTAPGDLPERVRGHAWVSDQSGAHAVFHIAGPGARRLLQRGLAIDLHPDAFLPGAVVVSAIAHIGVIVRAADHGDAFDVSVPRSLARSFLHWADGVAASLAPQTRT